MRAALEPAGVKVIYAHGCEYSTRPATWHLIPHPWFRGEYFANPDLSGEPVARRTERPLCFECNTANGSGGLPDGVPVTGASVRWRGELQTTLPGAYQFRVRGRGGFRLTVDNQRIVDAWISTPGEASVDSEKSGSCELPDNASVPIILEYVQGDGPVKVALDWITPAGAGLEAEAVEAAKNADVVVFVGGISAQLEGEEMQVDFDDYSGGDRRRIELPPPQQRLLEKLHATGKPLVYVNLSGSAVAMPWANEHANAILQAWYPGQAGGTAVADVLLGSYNPAGRLPVTFYRSTSDLPEFANYAMANRTYRYFKGTPLYPFGHGLSYTKFDYSNLQVERRTDGNISVSVVIKNAGGRDGDEVVQLYAVPPSASHPRETEALCGFHRLHLAKDETRTVTMVVPASALRRWNPEKDDYDIPRGEWTIRAGASSTDIRQSSPLNIQDT
jgi:beta-glucosidase